MKKEELLNEVNLFLVLAIIFILVFLFLYPTITGFITYTSGVYNWSFEYSNDYIYNESLIEISNNQAKLKSVLYDFTNYLVSDYHFDEESWINTTLQDSKGNNYGTAYNGADTLEQGKINRAGNFDGFDDYVGVGNDSSLMPDQFTILAWIKANKLPGKKEWYGIISKGDYDSGNGYELYIRSSDTKTEPNKICFGLDSTRIFSMNLPIVNEWIHIAGLYNGTTISLYINGELQESIIATLHPNILPLYIGRRYSNSSYVFDGVIDEVSIYHTALSQQEILKIYNIQNQGSRDYIYYPENASLETPNLDLPNTNQDLLFSKNEDLNNQIINYYYYYYSSDNGANWSLIPENGSLPSLEQIKIKAEFISDKTDTPILYDMLLSYQYCIENWDCSNWSECNENNSKSRICNDLNECGTSINKPEETENCTYSSESNETEPVIVSSPSSSEGSSGGSSGGSRTFTRPSSEATVEKPVVKEVTEETTEIKEEVIPKIETPKIEEKNPLQKFTGFVSYNIGEGGINFIILSIFMLIAVFVVKKFKRKNLDNKT